jgi:hypothetical protein
LTPEPPVFARLKFAAVIASMILIITLGTVAASRRAAAEETRRANAPTLTPERLAWISREAEPEPEPARESDPGQRLAHLP